MWHPWRLGPAGLLVLCVGCLSVKTDDVEVELKSPIPPIQTSSSSDSDEPKTPYAKALEKVIHQQDVVAKELQKRDWDELLDESGDWVEYVRKLSSYAHKSHDPPRFRRYCDELLDATQAVRRAAQSYDAGDCRRALDKCDPLLDRFVREFPLTEPAAWGAAGASEYQAARIP